MIRLRFSRLFRYRRFIFIAVGTVVIFSFATLAPPASFTSFSLLTPPAHAVSLSACGKGDPFCLDTAAKEGEVIGEKKITPAAAVGKIVQLLLGFIGVVFFFLMFWGGFRWMTARGNQENADSGKTTLENAVMGFLVVLIAYALTTFIVENLFDQGVSPLTPRPTSDTPADTTTCAGTCMLLDTRGQCGNGLAILEGICPTPFTCCGVNCKGDAKTLLACISVSARCTTLRYDLLCGTGFVCCDRSFPPRPPN
ncbi:hypothetical protein A3J43_03030 [Candidatus Uhrbacteria bacterium RIFCSPHIGHO2_12_FULL_54_23]|uniref:Uncharacterized protein n=2 Tax=Candidatus Uhriibacteriota TaxID=1752732 RepID=A0A1F7UGE9_9BACT|nr:MAG: hypothetical protein A3J43_03030 [Candidatus Uhrbacteria bacterium RIFCSPHIGHO2_12_FULL_54_23]OGL90136.1 MAG: hypothetical protein A3J36_02410 [Candidatus Uhrbacteria bacterium RIFCSPLOWO2_02_FULL_54_37]